MPRGGRPSDAGDAPPKWDGRTGMRSPDHHAFQPDPHPLHPNGSQDEDGATGPRNGPAQVARPRPRWARKTAFELVKCGCASQNQEGWDNPRTRPVT